MSAPIRRLSSRLANQIAAGEVVERPASVVKELIENAVDAGATHIQIDLGNGGTQRIAVSDDGVGIPKADLSLAVARHATSKIAEIADLDGVATMGFRGEALASIASVSKFCLCSKAAGAAGAWQVSVSGAEQQADVMPASHTEGSTVTVEDLFFNTPARRRFLKSDNTELFHIETCVKRAALAHFDIGFTLKNDGRTLLHCPRALSPLQQEARLKTIFGKKFIDNCVHVERGEAGLTLSGWVALPGYTRSQTDQQYLYVNRRMVRDRVLNHAIRQSYEMQCPPGRHIAYCLDLQVDPKQVDVNVHPTKAEVRFQQGRLVHDFLRSSLEAVFAGDVQTELFEETVSDGAQDTLPATPHAEASFYLPQKAIAPSKPKVSGQQQMRDYGELIAPVAAPAETEVEAEVCVAPPHVIATLQHWVTPRHLLCQLGETCLLVDWLASMRHRLYLSLERGLPLLAHSLFLPVAHTTSTEVVAVFMAAADLLSQCGFEVEESGPKSVLLRAVPAPLLNWQQDDIPAQLEACLSSEEALTPQTLLQALVQQLHPEEELKAGTGLKAFLADIAADYDAGTLPEGTHRIVSEETVAAWLR